MRLALIGKEISHSKSPELYQKLIGPSVSYDLLDITSEGLLPKLSELALKYDAINITTPYKEHYFGQILVLDPFAVELGAVNTILLKSKPFIGANTDIAAVETILSKFLEIYPSLHVILLGSGTMAQLTLMICKKLGIYSEQKARSLGDHMNHLDLSEKKTSQTIVINSCSRDYIFRGKLNSDHIFWDYNYRFLPHQQIIPGNVKVYLDGQEMLRLQAAEALKFWSSN